MGKKRRDLSKEIGDVVYSAIDEMIYALVDSLKKLIFRPFPMIMKKLSKKIVMKYIWLAVFGLVGVLIFSIGIAELLVLAGIIRAISYLIVGLVLIILGLVQYKLN